MKRAYWVSGLLLVALAGCTSTGSPSAAGPSSVAVATTSAAAPSPTLTTSSEASSAPTSAAPPKATELLDMRTVKITDGARIDLPAVPACPAASVPVAANGGHAAAAANGCKYSLYGEVAIAYGDLTGDGHAELVLLVTYEKPQATAPGRVLVAVGATGPSTYKTIASGLVAAAERAQGIRVQAGKIVGYYGTYQHTITKGAGTYHLSGSRILAL